MWLGVLTNISMRASATKNKFEHFARSRSRAFEHGKGLTGHMTLR